MNELDEIEIAETICDLANKGLVQIERPIGDDWWDATVSLTLAGWSYLKEASS